MKSRKKVRFDVDVSYCWGAFAELDPPMVDTDGRENLQKAELNELLFRTIVSAVEAHLINRERFRLLGKPDADYVRFVFIVKRKEA